MVCFFAFVVVCLLVIMNIYIYLLFVSIIHNKKDMVGEARRV